MDYLDQTGSNTCPDLEKTRGKYIPKVGLKRWESMFLVYFPLDQNRLECERVSKMCVTVEKRNLD